MTATTEVHPLTDPPIVLAESLEYRSGTGKVLTCGDRLKVDGVRGRYEMRRYVERTTDHFIEAMAHTKYRYGKIYRFDPEDCHLRGGHQGPSKYVHKWRERHDFSTTPDPDPEPRVNADEGQEDAVPEGHERLGPCRECGGSWTREIVRGRKPLTCPDCK